MPPSDGTSISSSPEAVLPSIRSAPVTSRAATVTRYLPSAGPPSHCRSTTNE
jgi:hypothetical protein